MNPTLQKTLVFDAVVPGTVNRAASHRLDASGKGVNVARVLTQLGMPNLHLTQSGGHFRDLFLRLCADDGVRVETVESGSEIRFCHTVISGTDGGPCTELVEESDPVGQGTEERLLAAYARLLEDDSLGVTCVVISGSKAGGFSPALVPELVRLAKSSPRRVILDLRGADLTASLPFHPDLIKPNLYEFARTFAPDLVANNEFSGDRSSVIRKIAPICGKLAREYGTSVVLTNGAASIWYSDDSELREFRVEPLAKPLNPIGSGDAFTAGLACALEKGRSLAKALPEAARCGRLNAALLRPGVIR
jgi:1-phosphofructokinase/tagatose 6-phosphate kinase